jgi:hypothetical protein
MNNTTRITNRLEQLDRAIQLTCNGSNVHTMANIRGLISGALTLIKKDEERYFETILSVIKDIEIKTGNKII